MLFSQIFLYYSTLYLILIVMPPARVTTLSASDTLEFF